MKYLTRKKRNRYLVAAAAILLAALCGFFIQRTGKGKSGVTICGLRTCHIQNPLGIDETSPVFSWQMKSGRTGAAQSARRIRVALGKEELAEGKLVWDSGRIEEKESAGICYEGEPLMPETRYFWQVEVWDELGKKHMSLEDAWFETGLMGEGMPEAKWISAPGQEAPEADIKGGSSYFIHYRMEVEDTAASFVFGANEGYYGTMNLCEIENRGGEATFRLKRMEKGGILDGEEIAASHCVREESSLFDVDLSIEEEKLGVSINGVKVGDFSVESAPVGSIGCYKSRGAGYARLDDIRVSDGADNLLYQENFEKEETIFSPYYTATEEGKLKIKSGLLLTKGKEEPAPFFRKEFSLPDKKIKAARVYMTALGSFVLSVNGQRASEEYFAPGKLIYNQELSYVSYDITELLEEGGDNALGIILLHGWYDRAAGYPEIWNPWGDKNALLGKVKISYEDGSVQEFATDKSFQCYSDGPVRQDDIYQGEYYDAGYEQTGFDRAGFQGQGWRQAEENQIEEVYRTLPLNGKKNEPVVCVKTLEPVSVSEPEENVFVYDFGQNFAGTCRIKVRGKKGQALTLRYGEELNGAGMKNRDDKEGTVWTANLLTAKATDYYVLKGGEEEEIFEPEFTFHGFRYLQITGLEEALPKESVEGIVLSSDLEQTGEFTCSSDALNRYYQNTLWSQRSNFIDNPTDCPQRDERHGWAGDAQIFSLTASYNMDTYVFYEKYLRELRLLQGEKASFPDMAPRNFDTQWDGTGGAASHNCWGDAPLVIAWNLYHQYGDRRILEENYDAFCKWVNMLEDTSDDFIRNWDSYGDHLALEDTPADLSDTAWCARSADLLSRMAGILGKEEDAARYEQVYNGFRQAWRDRYVLPDGRTICDSQTSYALGLAFDLFPEELKGAAAERLETIVREGNFHMKTGYSGIGYLLPALSRNGLTETAYGLLLQEEFPSLLYTVSRGATTTWESLQAYLEEEDGYLLNGSLNHYAYGTPALWLYTDVLGIRGGEGSPGFQHIILEPQAGGGLSFARGSYTGVYGKISVEWKKTDNGYEYRFEIPANTAATLTLPLEETDYLVDGKGVNRAKGVTVIENNGEKIKYELVSGTYLFAREPKTQR